MSRLMRLLRAMDPRVLHANASRTESLAASLKTLREELRGIRREMQAVTAQLDAVQLHVDQVAALRVGEQDAYAKMERLERVLDMRRVAAHVRDAVARAELLDNPVPHAVIADVLPADVYEAVITTLPAAVFFEGKGAQELRLPPRLAPTHTVAAWTFMSNLVAEALGPALVERFREPLERHVAAGRGLRPGDCAAALKPTEGRIVLRRPGHDTPADRRRPSDLLTIVMPLVRGTEGEEFGSVLHARTFAFRANSAVCVLDAAGALEYAPIPATAPAAGERYTYEFRMAVAAAARPLTKA